ALEALYRGGIIHDIGKIGVPDAILLKPGPLDSYELERMRMHPVIGEAIVKPLRSGASLLPIIRHHHEHFDGSGYPDGLAGRAIPIVLVSAVTLVGRIPSLLGFTPPLMSQLSLVAFVGSGYALLRYRGSLIPLPRAWHAAAGIVLGGAVVADFVATGLGASKT